MTSLTSLSRRAALLFAVAALAPASAVAQPGCPLDDPDCDPGGDTTPPATQLTGGPTAGAHITDSTPTFTFSSNESGSFECKVDNASWATCSSPKTVAQLADGDHTFSVRAIDTAENVDASPASRSFKVDTQAPSVTFSGGPANDARIKDSTPSYQFNTNDANPTTRQCKVDNGAWNTCSTPYTAPVLSDGQHTVSIRATDVAGNTSSPVSRAVVVDTVAPIAVIAFGATTDETTPTIPFSAPHDGGGAYEYLCRLDNGSDVKCDSGSFTPASPLAEGEHTLAVKAKDSVGNEQIIWSVKAFTVDVPEPSAVTPDAGGGATTGTGSTPTGAPTPAPAAPAPEGSAPGAAATSSAAVTNGSPRAVAVKRAGKRKAASCGKKALSKIKSKKARKAAAKRCTAKKAKKRRRR